MNKSNDLELLAMNIAKKAHAGVKDKGGDDYIWHPARVAARLTTKDEKIVAWLHDVIEDTTITAEDLSQYFSPKIVQAILLLTRTKEVDKLDYYLAIKKNPLALKVKLADIADNTDLERMKKLPVKLQLYYTKKYQQALEVLNSDFKLEN
jgi:(p)ppGpp synthase/HD superfamily hydrolase